MFNNIITKKCSKCFQEKNIIEFSKKRNSTQSWCKACESIRTKIWYQKNKEKRNKKAREWEAANRDKINTAKRIKRQKQKELLPIKPKKEPFDKNKWNFENKDKLAGYKRKWLQKNPTALIADRIRRRINMSIAKLGYKKTSKSTDIIGCDWETLKKHIELQFKNGMNWDNRNKWHIDHIIPLSSAKTEEDVIKLNHYTNLRPLWAKDNLMKSDKLEFLI